MEKELCIDCHKKADLKLPKGFKFSLCSTCGSKSWKYILMTKKDGNQRTKLPLKYFDEMPYIPAQNPHMSHGPEMKLYMLGMIIEEAKVHGRGKTVVAWDEISNTLTWDGRPVGPITAHGHLMDYIPRFLA
eukprot:Phypoly_transcript_26342.p1 GENE.Phypoly_transcript_26342~~Phypoly_transcript_26342.p1  ORF type:complete len:146 (+),score=20.14 Phypoly_transcript_26342:48-440(+)